MSKESLGKWISILYRYGRLYMKTELGPYQIGKGQFLFLMALYQKDGLTQEEVAYSLDMDKGTTARALNKLEQNGYVAREQNLEDLRSNQVFLTEKAKALKPKLYSIFDNWTKVLSSGMEEEDLEKVFSLLARMANNAKDYIQKERKNNCHSREEI